VIAKIGVRLDESDDKVRLRGMRSILECPRSPPAVLWPFCLSRSEMSNLLAFLADLPWQFINRTRKAAPEYRRLSPYGTMDSDVISTLSIAKITVPTAHLYLGVPNALLHEGLRVIQAGEG
jgi:hypothetical protein